ncbi:choice-of-anchor J domain-containing protein [Flavobacterium sp.]|uniref:choice-of-anchor J domain-containing protein n=1 Tax=Flavobacterium sp. TaxID=239 RepID=UPI002610BE10|nr:choice-of-anchor J domain-containing protein [Flavobacterium sp.]
MRLNYYKFLFGLLKNRALFKLFVFVLFFLFQVNQTNAQVGSYAFTQSATSFAYTPLTGGTVAYSGAWDNHVAGSAHQANLGFSFLYDGVSFTNCYISPNGFITFGSLAQPVPTNYTPINTNTIYETTSGGAISALGTDLISGGFDIVYQTIGTAPNRTFVVEWKDAVRKTVAGTFNFQIRLSETTNVISLSYGLCQPLTTTNVAVQVGLRGLNNLTAQGNTFSRAQGTTSQWLSFTNVGVANSTVNTNVGAYPNSNLLYTFTPPVPCTTPSAQPTSLVVGATSILHNSINGNSFVAASPAASKYLVLVSTVNTPPTAAIITNRSYYAVGTTYSGYRVLSASALVTFTATTLLPNQTYYFWVIPYNDSCFGAPFYNLTNILTASATTCSTPTVVSPLSSIGGNEFTATWTAIAGVTDYQIDVSTNAAFTALVPGYSSLSLGNATTSLVVSGLSPLTTYYCRVKAIGTGCLVNSNTVSATTTCGYYNIPYSQNFDGTAVGSLPSCYVVNNVNGDANQWSVNNLNFASASRSIQINSNPSQDMNDWFFVPGLNLTGGTSYRLFFRYNTGNTSSTSESLQVSYGTSQTPLGMSSSLVTLSSFDNSFYSIAQVDFTPSTSGVYYIGFQGISLANQSYIVIDDIRVTVSPTCIEPTNVEVSGITPSSATISWTAASPLPSLGYQYYLSTSSTAPTLATVPTGSVGAGITTATLSGLNSSTYYYVWVRSNCSASDKSVWTLEESFNTECSTPTITSTTPTTRCGYGTTTLSATSSVGSFLRWFDTPTGNNLLATGTSYTTPFISSTTTYYVEAKSFGAIAKVGPVSPATQLGILGVQNYQSAVTFDVISNTILQSIDIFPIVSGQTGRVAVRNSSNTTVAQINFTTTVSGGNTPQIIPINYEFEPGNYNLYFEIVPTSGVRMNTSNAIYPYSSSVAYLTGNLVDGNYYLGFYNWKFTTECLSSRVPVIATVTAPPALTLSQNTATICEDYATPLITVSGYASYSSLVWTPNTNISGSFASGFTFNPTTTTTYTLVGNQSSGSLCGNIATITVVVNAAPPSISILPPTSTICYNSVQPLNGSTSSATPSMILTQNFNGATNDWIVANTSVGGNVLASQWTLQPSNYNYISPFWNVVFSSNDLSQYYLANSDAQSSSSGVITRTTLTSPSFNLAGYTSANLNYWHYLRYTDNDNFYVQVSTDNGATWTTIQSYLSTQGAPASFVNATLNLNSYLGQTNVKVRFNFISPWAYVWAVDNVTISGTLAAALSWTPTTGLYTDVAATIPYVAGTPLSVVYAKPLSSTTYTATITASNSCFRTSTASITVTPLTVSGTISSSQTICNGSTASNITLSGNVGNVVRWEYADDAAFTVNVTSIANTTTTLTPAQMGVFSSIRYFRAIVKNGVCNEASSNIVFVSYPSTTWNGISWSNGLPDNGKRLVFNGTYNPSSDALLVASGTPFILNACSVLVQSGTVTFPNNYVLNVQNTVNVVAGNLTFQNGASLVQSNDVVNLPGLTNGGNVGNITYQRSTTIVGEYDYTYWSSPVSPQTLTNMSPDSPNDYYYYFSPAIANWVNINSNNLMEAGKGYIVRAPYYANNTSGYTSSFIGVPNSGTITTPIVVGTPGFGEMNLIGNPYPSSLRAISFLSNPLNTNVVDATMYFWTHNTPITANNYTADDYAMFNYSGSVSASPSLGVGVNNATPNGFVASGQSFFIKGINSGGNVTFQNNMRGSGYSNSQFFRSSEEISPSIENEIVDLERNRFWLDIFNNEGAFKQTMVGYIEQATNDLDRGFDGLTFNSGNVINFYSLINPTTIVGIQGRALPFEIADVVPLGYSTTLNGIFQIQLSNYDGLFINQDIYLRDKVLNVVHNLKLGNYIFNTLQGTFNDRFEIIYQNNALHTDEFNANSVVLYKPDELLHINSGNKTMKELKVFDMRGRLIATKENIFSSETTLDLGKTNQVLLIQITTDDLIVVTKKYTN